MFFVDPIAVSSYNILENIPEYVLWKENLT